MQKAKIRARKIIDRASTVSRAYAQKRATILARRDLHGARCDAIDIMLRIAPTRVEGPADLLPSIPAPLGADPRIAEPADTATPIIVECSLPGRSAKGRPRNWRRKFADAFKRVPSGVRNSSIEIDRRLVWSPIADAYEVLEPNFDG